jgi:hypothetical protein
MEFIKKHKEGYLVEIYLMGKYELVGIFKTKKAAQSALDKRLKTFLK